MRLTQRIHHVTDVAWGNATRLGQGILEINREDLAKALLTDRRLADVQLELARPGESCRMVQVFDVVEPRTKLDPVGADFPGAIGPVQPVGFGVTRVLRGLVVSVLNSAELPNFHVIDMRTPLVEGHPAAEATPYAGMNHVVIIPHFAEGIEGDERLNVLRMASLRAAVHLAKTADVGAADEAETFGLTPVAEGLPRVAYVCQLHSHQFPTVPGEPLLYGDNCRYLLPTILHPNEIIDGAVVRCYYQLNMQTYSIQNNAVVLDLLRRHGRDLNFVGVVVNVASQLDEERARTIIMSGNLVRWTLRADGAVFTKSCGGAPNVDMALVADRCEQLGVKTTLTLWEQGLGNSEDALLFNSPSLDAIVSLGATALEIELGPVDRVLAATAEGSEALRGPVAVTARCPGMIDQLGSSRFTIARY